MVWFQTIADWGFNYTATRDVAKNRDDKEKVSEIFSNVLWARILLMLVSFVALAICVMTIPKLRENADVIMISFLMIPGHIMFPDWFFQAMERMKYITILNIISKTLFTIAIFLFIKEREDYILQPLFTSLGFVVSGIIAMYYILIKWKIRLHFTSFKVIIKTIKSSTDVFINNLMPNLWNALSTVLLGFLWGNVANGILDAGKRFQQTCGNLFGVVTRVFYPFLSRRIDQHRLYVKVSMSLAFVMMLLLFVFAPIIIDIFFGEEFSESVIVLRLYAISLLFWALDNVYGVNYMLVNGYDKQLRNMTIISSIVACISAYPLIYFYSYVGVAIVYNIGLGLLGVLPMIFTINDKRKKNLNN
jgi:PST family polysaccharide transporter